MFPRNKRINLVCWEGPNIGSASTNSFHFMSQESNSSCFIEGQQYGLSLTFIQHLMLMKHEQGLHFEQIVSTYSVSGKLLFLFEHRATYSELSSELWLKFPRNALKSHYYPKIVLVQSNYWISPNIINRHRQETSRRIYFTSAHVLSFCSCPEWSYY